MVKKKIKCFLSTFIALGIFTTGIVMDNFPFNTCQAAAANEESRHVMVCYPEGKLKALTFSYDDGKPSDKKLIEIFNKYGMKATFNLISGRLASLPQDKLQALPALYKNHEVASHSLSHGQFINLTNEQIEKEIYEDQINLEKIFGYKIRGFAYPYGGGGKQNDPDVITMISSLGIKYARTIASSKSFAIPSDFMKWASTCHHNEDLLQLGDQFLASQPKEISLMSVWGHSVEFDEKNNWNVMEEFCRKMSQAKDIWYATNIEVVDYVNATKKLVISGNQHMMIKNPSILPVWVKLDDETVEIAAESVIEYDVQTKKQNVSRISAMQELYDQVMNDSVALYIGSSSAYVSKKRTAIDKENATVKPVMKDGSTLVPVRFISENFDAKVEWVESTGTIIITKNDIMIQLQLNNSELDINGQKQKLTVPPQVFNERTFIPLRAFVEALGKMVCWDDRGLIVIGSEISISMLESESIAKELIIANFMEAITEEKKIREDARIHLSLDLDKTTLSIGETANVKVYGVDKDGNIVGLSNDVKYTIHDTGVAAIDENGKITAVNPGMTELTVSAKIDEELQEVSTELLISEDNNSISDPWMLNNYNESNGSAMREGSSFTFNTNGTTVWGKEDDCMYFYQKVNLPEENTNLSVTVVLDSIKDIGVQDTALGIMIRDRNSADAKNVMLRVLPNGGVRFTYRNDERPSSAFILGPAAAFPIELRINRSGDTFKSYIRSENETNWTFVGAVNVKMSCDFLAGIALYSGDRNIGAEATVRNICIVKGSDERLLQ